MLVRICSNRNSYSLVVGVQNGIATLEDSLAVLTFSPSICHEVMGLDAMIFLY